MSTEQTREMLKRLLHTIAPEVDLDSISASEDLREALDLDSMDFLNFVIGIHKELGVEIPEGDYRKLASLEDCVQYLQKRTGRA